MTRGLLFTALLVCVGTPADTPRFAPAERSSLVKTFTSEWTVTTQPSEVFLEGQRLPTDDLGRAARRQRRNQRLVVTDRWMRVEGGRPLALDRTFDELVQTVRTDIVPDPKSEKPVPDPVEAAYESRLEGATVRFAFDAAKTRYEATAAGRELPPEILAGLREDFDLRALLPSVDVSVGDEWKVDVRSLWSLSSPLGDVAFALAGQEAAPPKAGESAAPEPAAEGEATARYAGIRERDGRRLAVVEFAVDTSLDRPIERVTGAAGAAAEVQWKFGGRLVWDLGAGHVDAFEMTGEMTLVARTERKVEREGREFTVESTTRAHGALQIELETQRP